MNSLRGLMLPLKFDSGRIMDAAGKTVIRANRDANTTPLSPVGRDAILALACKLLNDAFTYDHADRILNELGY
jgi:hypothetical protein